MTAIYLKLMKSFMLVGLGAYGGGLVTIPLIQHEIVIVQAWLTMKELTSLLAVAQMTPGPIAINAATFVGYQIGDWQGACLATFSVVFPSVCLMALVAGFFDKISSNKGVQRAQRGLQIGVLSLIFCATWSFGSVAIGSWFELLMGLTAFALLVLSEGRLHPALVIFASGLAGLFFF